MKVFSNFPQGIKGCPICHTTENKPCILVGIDGTEDGMNMQAAPTHVECVELRWSVDADLFYQRVTGGRDYVHKTNDSSKLGGHDVVPNAEQRQEDTSGVDVREEGQGLQQPEQSDSSDRLSDNRG